MIKAPFYYLLFSIVVFSGVSLSLQKSTKLDCEAMGSESLACKQLEKENLINQFWRESLRPLYKSEYYNRNTRKK